MGVFWEKGGERISYYTIEISQDGTNWTQVFSGESNGRASELEIYPMSGETARYVRIQVDGTSAGTWNSLSEVAILKAETEERQ